MRPVILLILFTILLGCIFELLKPHVSPARAFMIGLIITLGITFATYKLKEGLNYAFYPTQLKVSGNVYAGTGSPVGNQLLSNLWLNPILFESGKAFGNINYNGVSGDPFS
jgi:hypothetical protein